jgi:hypothetical protein
MPDACDSFKKIFPAPTYIVAALGGRGHNRIENLPFEEAKELKFSA